ncbi:MAG TPA: UbiX family flavin prenyltransferase [Caldimonas sp.]
MAAGSGRVVVGVTGASGAIYAVRLLERLRRAGREIHLVATAAGLLNVHHELGLDRKALEALADVAYKPGDIGAAIASGSFAADATVIAPCSMKSLAAIAHGFSDNLLTRAADVALKERRKLVLMVRETPLNLAHLRNMTSATEMGAIVFPPLPAFYHRPTTIDEIVDETVERVVALLGIEGAAPKSWAGLPAAASPSPRSG